MSKILKVVLQAGAIVAPLIPGIGWIAEAAIIVGAAVGTSLLSRHPKAPQASPEGICRMRAHIQ